MPDSTTRTLVTFITVMLGVLGIIIAAGIGGISLVNIARSFANGGTYYATGHLAAVAALRRFAVSRSQEDFEAYLRNIHVPISDGTARAILDDRELPVENSYPFLIAGKNHPDDVAGIAWLYRTFSHTASMRPAIEVWRQADAEVQRLDVLADRLYRTASTQPGTALAEIDEASARLEALEGRFSRELGEAARRVGAMLHVGLAGFGAALAALVLALGYRTHRRLSAAQQAVRDREARFRDI